MVAQPGIAYHGPVPNLWVGQGQQPKLAIVAHVMAGTIEGADSWFKNPAAKASANYGVAKDGRIWCWVDPAGPDAPFANGLVQNPDPTVQRLIDRAGDVN